MRFRRLAIHTIVGTPLPILKSILAKTVIYPIGVPAGRISAAIRQPVSIMLVAPLKSAAGTP
ncbi:MAG: hypothetical protein CBARDMAM_1969 [uncultured Caballeronia sp.]|nr:MAG: hypothetical protein CBARDMAM_1969 [uncultured Caballeronia sp.]